MDELTLAIVGIDFANSDKSKSNRRFELMQCNPGDQLDLVPEPKNPFDEHAIAVFAPSGIQVGYLPAARAPWISALIRRGEHVAIFQGMDDGYGYVRIRFGGGAPTLPPPAPPRPPAPIVHDVDEQGDARITRQRIVDDFYPDTEGPDWGA